MQENIQVPTPEITPQIVTEQPKQSNFLTILLSVLLTISVIVSGFFAYQTQKLVKELTLLRTEPTSTTPFEPTTEPVATKSSEVDPTAVWKTYKNSTYNYSLDISSGWIIGEESYAGAASKINPNLKVSSIKFNNKLSSIQIFYEGDFDHGFEPWQFESKKDVKLGGKNAVESILKLDGNLTKWHILSIDSLGDFRIEANIHPDDLNNYNQILSTFKFLD